MVHYFDATEDDKRGNCTATGRSVRGSALVTPKALHSIAQGSPARRGTLGLDVVNKPYIVVNVLRDGTPSVMNWEIGPGPQISRIIHKISRPGKAFVGTSLLTISRVELGFSQTLEKSADLILLNLTKLSARAARGRQWIRRDCGKKVL